MVTSGRTKTFILHCGSLLRSVLSLQCRWTNPTSASPLPRRPTASTARQRRLLESRWSATGRTASVLSTLSLFLRGRWCRLETTRCGRGPYYLSSREQQRSACRRTMGVPVRTYEGALTYEGAALIFPPLLHYDVFGREGECGLPARQRARRHYMTAHRVIREGVFGHTATWTG